MKKHDVVSAFGKAGVSLSRQDGVLFGRSPSSANGGVRVDLTPDESGITALKVLFPAVDAEAFRTLIHAMWEGVMPNRLWKTKVDECIEGALNGKPFEEITDGIEIKLLYHGTEAELVATRVPSSCSS
jgi:hypothetical protein